MSYELQVIYHYRIQKKDGRICFHGYHREVRVNLKKNIRNYANTNQYTAPCMENNSVGISRRMLTIICAVCTPSYLLHSLPFIYMYNYTNNPLLNDDSFNCHAENSLLLYATNSNSLFSTTSADSAKSQ